MSIYAKSCMPVSMVTRTTADHARQRFLLHVQLDQVAEHNFPTLSAMVQSAENFLGDFVSALNSVHADVMPDAEMLRGQLERNAACAGFLPLFDALSAERGRAAFRVPTKTAEGAGFVAIAARPVTLRTSRDYTDAATSRYYRLCGDLAAREGTPTRNPDLRAALKTLFPLDAPLQPATGNADNVVRLPARPAPQVPQYPTYRYQRG